MVQQLVGSLVGIIVGIVVLLIVVGAAYMILKSVESTMPVRQDVKDMINVATSFTNIIIIIALAGLIIVVLLGARLGFG